MSGFLIIFIFANNEIHGPIMKLWNPCQYPIKRTTKITETLSKNPTIVNGQTGSFKGTSPIWIPVSIKPIEIMKSYLTMNETRPKTINTDWKTMEYIAIILTALETWTPCFLYV